MSLNDPAQSPETTPKKIKCYWYPSTNFGDAMNPWLISKISQGQLQAVWEYSEPNYVCIGSILTFPPIRPYCIVWGSGIMCQRASFGQPAEVRAVRGPLTARRFRELGFPSTEVYGDPSLLAPLLYHPLKKFTNSNHLSHPSKPKLLNYELGVIPHNIEYQMVKRAFEQVKDRYPAQQILIIDLMKPTEEIIDQMVSCDRFVSSSLHGLIVPQAYGKPAAWVKFSDQISGDGTKYHDYLQSVQLDEKMTCHSVLDINFGQLLEIAQTQAMTINPIVLRNLQQGLWDTCPFHSEGRGKSEFPPASD